ncbi:hypothetical protein Taro_010267, partial [Colocasia esculenta]|nr:hypothetical protein [Colocasia esculenta]
LVVVSTHCPRYEKGCSGKRVPCRPALECVDLLSQFLKLAVLGTGSSVDLLYECVDLLSQFLKLAVLGTGSSVDLLYECVDLDQRKLSKAMQYSTESKELQKVGMDELALVVLQVTKMLKLLEG